MMKRLKSCGRSIQRFWKQNVYFALLFGPLCGVLTSLIFYYLKFELPMVKMLGVTVHMVLWWLEGRVRMGLTGLLPIVLLPCLGISNGTKISQIYFSDSVVVCMGSLIMASAVEIYGLHHRSAKIIMKYAQSGGVTAILGAFIFITGFISMWLSNTATAALMIPLSRAIFVHIQQSQSHLSPKRLANLGIAIDVSIAFASSLGGMATLTGTGSNLVLQGTMMSMFGKEGKITFLEYFLIAAPLTIVNLFILWFILSTIYLCPCWFSRSTRRSSRTQSEAKKRTHEFNILHANTISNDQNPYTEENPEEKHEIEMKVITDDVAAERTQPVEIPDEAEDAIPDQSNNEHIYTFLISLPYFV
jgi:di/tricarboxylate transporter